MSFLELSNTDVVHAEVWVAGLVGTVATVEDLARRTVSNWLPALALAGGLAGHSVVEGWRGAGSALLGAVGGFCVFLVFYLLGGMGGGDVKLMAGFGAILGVGRLLPATLLAAVFGAAIAAGVLGVSAILRVLKKGGRTDRPLAIPYAPAIVMGVWLTLFASL
ncbi:MAG: prepilin peptidase [Acidobacteriia bacterium]|nr:prepilin peptidase [Terriglobia bacterium]